MISDDKSGIGSLLLPILLISTVTLGFLYSGNLKELSKTQAQLEAERAERDRLEAVIHGVMLGGAR